MPLERIIAGAGVAVTQTGKAVTITASGGGGAHASSHQPGGNDAMAVDASAGTGSLRTLGTGAQQACAGNDARLSDARTPLAHNHVREDLVAQWDLGVTKTNIGASFADVYTQTNADGKSVQIDTTGKTQVRLFVLWNKLGTGTQTVQVLEVGTANVLISLNVASGRNVSALVDIPAALAGAVKNYKLQAKSTVAGDDPVFEGARVYLK